MAAKKFKFKNPNTGIVEERPDTPYFRNLAKKMQEKYNKLSDKEKAAIKARIQKRQARQADTDKKKQEVKEGRAAGLTMTEIRAKRMNISADELKKRQIATLLGMAEGMSLFIPGGVAIKAGQLAFRGKKGADAVKAIKNIVKGKQPASKTAPKAAPKPAAKKAAPKAAPKPAAKPTKEGAASKRMPKAAAPKAAPKAAAKKAAPKAAAKKAPPKTATKPQTKTQAKTAAKKAAPKTAAKPKSKRRQLIEKVGPLVAAGTILGGGVAVQKLIDGKAKAGTPPLGGPSDGRKKGPPKGRPPLGGPSDGRKKGPSKGRPPLGGPSDGRKKGPSKGRPPLGGPSDGRKKRTNITAGPNTGFGPKGNIFPKNAEDRARLMKLYGGTGSAAAKAAAAGTQGALKRGKNNGS